MTEPPEKMPLHEDGPPTQVVEPRVVYQQKPETVYIHTLPATIVSHTKEHYKARLSIIFGITLICLHTLALILNAIGFGLQFNRGGFFPNIFIIVFPALWGSLFVYLSAGFAIGSGKTKSRCLIITHLVLAIIASVMIAALIAIALGSMLYDAGTISSNNPKAKDKGSFAMSLLLLAVGIAEFVLTIWSCVICGQALCCSQETSDDGYVSATVTKQTVPPPEGTAGESEQKQAP